MAALCHTADTAAAAASRCRSRCELRHAAGSYPRAGLVTRAQAAGSTVLLPSVRGRTGCLERRRHGCIDENLCAAYTAVGRSSRGREANIAASAASPSVRAGSRRGWLRLPCIGMRKHVQKVGRSSPPCPPHPCPRLLLIRISPAAAVLSLHLAAPQVQLDRLLDWVSSTRRRRPKASERASRPCSCRAALQLAGGGASCPAATTCSGPPAPAPGLSPRPWAMRAPCPRRGLPRAPGRAPEGGRGMAGARRPCAPAPGRAPPVLGRST